ncbi:MAG: hypothetical protein WC430_02800 [Patescibacteria group bacterium]
MFKKFLLILSVGILICVPAFARDYGLQETGSAAEYSQVSVYEYANSIVSVFLSVLAIFFLGLMLYSGIRWMTAHGNEEMLTKAKNIMEAAIIGLIIVVASYAISNFILERLMQ